MNKFVRNFKGQERKDILNKLNHVFALKKEQIKQAELLKESYQFQLKKIRETKNSEFPINALLKVMKIN